MDREVGLPFIADLGWLEGVERCLAFQSRESRAAYLQQIVHHASAFSELSPIRVRKSECGCAAFLLIYPGKLAMVGGVAPATSLESLQELEQTARLLEELIDSVRSEVELAQAVTFPDEHAEPFDAWRRECFSKAGLFQVAILKQCALDLSSLGDTNSEWLWDGTNTLEQVEASLTFLRWTPELEAEFEETVDRTYLGTEDVPELNGVRSTAATLEGYARTGSGSGSPRDWWLVRRGVESVGCLLVCRHSSELAELLYLGLTPESRKKGFAQVIVRYLVRWAQEQQVRRILLAVDSRNEPALKLYHRFGFEEVGVAQAWIDSI